MNTYASNSMLRSCCWRDPDVFDSARLIPLATKSEKLLCLIRSALRTSSLGVIKSIGQRPDWAWSNALRIGPGMKPTLSPSIFMFARQQNLLGPKPCDEKNSARFQAGVIKSIGQYLRLVIKSIGQDFGQVGKIKSIGLPLGHLCLCNISDLGACSLTRRMFKNNRVRSLDCLWAWASAL